MSTDRAGPGARAATTERIVVNRYTGLALGGVAAPAQYCFVIFGVEAVMLPAPSATRK